MKTSLTLLIAFAASLAFAGPQCHKQGSPKDCPRKGTDSTAVVDCAKAKECTKKKDCPKSGKQCAKPCPKDSSALPDSTKP
jgi:hypothetical protein